VSHVYTPQSSTSQSTQLHPAPSSASTSHSYTEQATHHSHEQKTNATAGPLPAFTREPDHEDSSRYDGQPQRRHEGIAVWRETQSLQESLGGGNTLPWAFIEASSRTSPQATPAAFGWQDSPAFSWQGQEGSSMPAWGSSRPGTPGRGPPDGPASPGVTDTTEAMSRLVQLQAEQKAIEAWLRSAASEEDRRAPDVVEELKADVARASTPQDSRDASNAWEERNRELEASLAVAEARLKEEEAICAAERRQASQLLASSTEKVRSSSRGRSPRSSSSIRPELTALRGRSPRSSSSRFDLTRPASARSSSSLRREVAAPGAFGISSARSSSSLRFEGTPVLQERYLQLASERAAAQAKLDHEIKDVHRRTGHERSSSESSGNVEADKKKDQLERDLENLAARLRVPWSERKKAVAAMRPPPVDLFELGSKEPPRPANQGTVDLFDLERRSERQRFWSN